MQVVPHLVLLCRRRRAATAVLLAICSSGCSESHRGRGGARDSAVGDENEHDAASVYDAGAKFDHSGPDLIRFNRPAEQSELEPARAFDTGCEECAQEEFCDLDHCAPLGRGGGAYVGGTYGFRCEADPSDPHLRAFCGGSRCMDGLCISCRSAEDCCRNDPDCIASDWSCLWWVRIQANYCFPKRTLAAGNIAIPTQ